MANGKKGKRQIAKPKGWWIIDREFETQKLQLLIDSVQSSRFIIPNKAKELTDKLKAIPFIFRYDGHAITPARRTAMNIIIRNETPADYRAVEELPQDALSKKQKQGCCRICNSPVFRIKQKSPDFSVETALLFSTLH